MSQRRKITLAAAAVVLVALVAGIGWVVWWLNDNIDAPGRSKQRSNSPAVIA